LADEGFIANVQDTAETAATQFGEFVDTEHLDIAAGFALRGEVLGQFDHLDVFETDARVDGAVDDGFGDVHTAADGGVVGGCHTVMGGEFVDLDLAEFADVADAFALKGAEVGGDA
jgi:hypothetical protein